MGELVIRPEHYGAHARAWEAGATLVYGPLADELAQRSPVSLDGLRVLDVGAGTGVGSRALRRVGADPVAVDFSHEMLQVGRPDRPPSVVGDATALPVGDRTVDAAYAAFVLNHLDEPGAALAELGRVVRRGGPVVADVFSAASQHDGRDAVDRVAEAWGWEAPPWYADIRDRAIPLLASGDAMRDAARAAGLTHVDVAEEAVDVGVTEPADLVAYRFGQAHFAPFVAEVAAAGRAADLVVAATSAAAEVMTPYRPTVVFLTALAP